MQNDAALLRSLFQATVKEQRANTESDETLIKRVTFSLLVQEREHHSKRAYWLALHCASLVLRIDRTRSLRSTWIELEALSEIGCAPTPSTPASNTGVTDTASQMLIDYVAGVK